jgi:hypothetical protein
VTLIYVNVSKYYSNDKKGVTEFNVINHKSQVWKAKGKKKLISVIECVSVKYGREENNQCQCGSGQKHLSMAYSVVYRVLIKTLPHLTKLEQELTSMHVHAT